MQVASAIESGVAQAAALATSMSADELANKLHERKQSVLPSSPTVTPRSPAGEQLIQGPQKRVDVQSKDRMSSSEDTVSIPSMPRLPNGDPGTAA